MPLNMPLIAVTTSYVVVAQDTLPIDLSPFERVTSYVGLLAMGFFFWKRESGRADVTNAELKEEIKQLKEEIKELESELREAIKNGFKANQPNRRYRND